MWSNLVGCNEGTNTIRVRAISSTSKTNQTQIFIIVDTQRPLAWFSFPTNSGTVSNTTVVATGGASDNGGTGVAGTYVKIDSENFFLVGTSSFSHTFSNLNEGNHSLSVYSKDIAGNISLTNSIAFSVALSQTDTNTNGYREYTNIHYNGDGYDILLQGFHWASTNGNWWNEIANKAEEIRTAGFTMVWLPPLSDCGDNNGYLPREWYNLSSKYGNGTQLSNAITSLKNAELKIIADIVINHRVGTYNWADFSNPAFPDNKAAVCSDDEWGQGTGASDTGEGYNAGRDLDHSNPNVRATIITWMKWLRQIGFDGWRYDYVKGYNPYYNSNYNEATKAYFSVGELWPDITGDYYASGANINYHRQALMNWIDASGGRSTVFDFTTKWQLMLAVERTEYWRLKDPDGKPIGAIGWWPAMSVTFIDNHDTGYSPGGGQHHWPFPQDKREIGYAYILTHPGIPSVYWYDFFDGGSYLKTVITNLIAIRKNQGIHATSPITILKAEATEYVALINSNTIVKLGPGMSFNTNWTLAASGTDWAVWTQ
ncbi:alpha-amylase [Thermospira aquatica]|uniref:Alpha-amylase n=2 Tax=Thermospira aquatica TaxID=2828656 RepID=A0AAX3BGC0_9SPIR|nr:alpha-amylase [Thermospira aquatica]